MRDVFYPILRMVGALEAYQERPQIKGQKNLRKLCNGAKNLLTVLGEDKVSDWELSENSDDLKIFVHLLKTLSDEADQEQIDEELVRFEYMQSVKHAPVLVRELVEFYARYGPESVPSD